MKRTIRYIGRIIATLMALLLLLTCPVPIPVRAASKISADRDDITVLSVTVNVNTETRMAYTELILSNNGAEEAELTFPLPEISAGIDEDALTVKTKDGQDVETDNGVVTLTVPAGGYAGLSYAYKTKKNLSYEGTIAFDLRQLTRQFNDRIGHIDWTVDMPLYELVLVKDIQPMNYTVKDNRVSVVLDDFTICRLLDRISLTRTTHAGLMAEAEESGDDSTIAQFIIENYRKWYRDPSAFIDQLMFYKSWEDDTFIIDSNKTLLNMYLVEKYSKYSPEEREELLQEIERFNPSIWNTVTQNTQLLFDDWLLSLGEVNPDELYYMMYSPALEAMLTSTDPEVYVILLTAQPALAGKKLGVEYYDYYEEIRIKAVDEMTLLKAGPHHTYYYKDDPRFVYVYLNEKDIDDLQVFRDYLSAIHAKAVIRSQIAMRDSDVLRDIEDLYDYRAYYAYSGTETYPYVQFSQDLIKGYAQADHGKDNYKNVLIENDGLVYLLEHCPCLLMQCEEPLKNELDIPIFTLYWGYAVPMEESADMLVSQFETYTPDAEHTCGIQTIRYLMEQPIPKQILDTRDAEKQMAKTTIADQIASARAELNLTATEASTEATTEGTTEITTEATEPAAEAATEAVTEPSTAATEAETQQASEESSGGNGLLIALIIALAVVGLGGTTAAVIMLKKNKKNE
ncbi:MAG: hypothetical protein IKS10_09660 [Lachnospiraceae bacterium]|nr:hypothetical protein [Lachnospiraceae bacterium]